MSNYRQFLLLFLKIMGFTFFLHVLSRHVLLFFNWNSFQITFYQSLAYFIKGIRFDASSFAYANTLFILLYFFPLYLASKRIYSRILFWVWFIPNILFLTANIADAFYFPFTLRRSTYDVLALVWSMKHEMSDLWLNFLVDFWPAIILVIAGIISLIKFFFKEIKKLPQFQHNVKYYLGMSSLLFFFAIITITAMRGGLQTKPISLVTAGTYAQPEHTSLVLNSAFSIIRTYGKSGLEKKSFFSEHEQLTQEFLLCKKYNNQPFKKKNIVIIILEGFSNEHLNSINSVKIDEEKNFAPFLDSLIHEGLFCINTFANGKRSVEGIPAILSSMPTLMNTPFILSPYVNNHFQSLPQLLEPLGYKSFFFHGGQNGTMNLDAYAMKAGFSKYFGKNEYPDKADFDGKWGIWDEPYLGYVAEMIETFEEPFMVSVFTLSSHHPYQIPEKYAHSLPEGPLQIHKSIAYSDLALNKFFHKISKSSWYYNTIFVITSDHSSEPYHDFYKSPVGNYSIPLLFYDPGAELNGIQNKICQQTDIMPSLLDYIGYTDEFAAFGNSIFDTSATGMNITFTSDYYQLVVDNMAAVYVNDKPVKLWNFLTDHYGTQNLIHDTQFSNQLNRLNLIYQTYIQQYHNSLIDNKTNCSQNL